MPAISPEAIERKNAKRRKKRYTPLVIDKSMIPSYKITARRMMTRLPDMTKAELRDMLTKAVENT